MRKFRSAVALTVLTAALSVSGFAIAKARRRRPRSRQRGKVVSDDPANHDLNDDKGARARRADDAATHDVNDDKGQDDPATHDARSAA
jgi:hypothetical protein